MSGVYFPLIKSVSSFDDFVHLWKKNEIQEMGSPEDHQWPPVVQVASYKLDLYDLDALRDLQFQRLDKQGVAKQHGGWINWLLEEKAELYAALYKDILEGKPFMTNPETRLEMIDVVAVSWLLKKQLEYVAIDLRRWVFWKWALRTLLEKSRAQSVMVNFFSQLPVATGFEPERVYHILDAKAPYL